ncbi:glycosyl transferase family 28 [Halomonas aquamarina]|uniref:Glycosyl transferase family 28 n=1 Tax=Vreelandella aquamarina TaxID=77097 RepID=A0ACC5VRB0_9GAMM|nr:glycosyltransferase [Halomonas aquamarina]MBZ5486433.1 glycosyl transferase family 28 [Halomonas aquamarina]
MIFITVGTQLPFDRLLEYFADWQSEAEYKGKVVAQVGQGSRFSSSSMEIYQNLSSDEYYHWFRQAEGIVSHTGMGSILSCLDYGKRGVFLAREYSLSEHRNDHQLDTTKAFENRYPSLAFCTQKEAFHAALDELVRAKDEPLEPAQSENGMLGCQIADYLGLKRGSK